MNLFRRFICISLPVAILLSGCCHQDHGRVSEANTIRNYDWSDDGFIWEEVYNKEKNGGWIRENDAPLNNVSTARILRDHNARYTNLDDLAFQAVDYPQVITLRVKSNSQAHEKFNSEVHEKSNPKWVKYNPRLLVVLGKAPPSSLKVADASATGGYIYYKITQPDESSSWGHWHSKSDKSGNLFTTSFLIQSLIVKKDLFAGEVIISARVDPSGDTITWTGKLNAGQTDFDWTPQQ
jgi:hypothetical protein